MKFVHAKFEFQISHTCINTQTRHLIISIFLNVIYTLNFELRLVCAKTNKSEKYRRNVTIDYKADSFFDVEFSSQRRTIKD